MTPLLAAAETLTPVAQWLNTFFAGFDDAILRFAYSLHESAMGGFWDAFLSTITKLGSGGIFFIVLSVILLLFKKTRKAGCAMLVAIIIGALFTNVTIKPFVERPRPYASGNQFYYDCWYAVNGVVESEIPSFPSGHATVSFASMGAFFAFMNKKWSWLGFVLAAVIGFSRNYLFVHYPSDIIGGMLIGFISALAAFFLVRFIAKKIEQSDNKAAVFLREFSLFSRKKEKEQVAA